MNAYRKIILTLIIFILSIIGIFFFSKNRKLKEVHEISTSNKPVSLKLDLDETTYQSLVNNPTANSIQLNLLNQNKSRIVTKKTNDKTEAMIVVLKGKGEVKVLGESDKMTMEISPDRVSYFPPNTEFSILNHTDSKLKYLYIVIDIL